MLKNIFIPACDTSLAFSKPKVTNKVKAALLVLCGAILLPSIPAAATTIKGPPVPTGWYTIQQKSTSRYLSARIRQAKDFYAFTDTRKETEQQRWYIKYINGDTYTIQQQSNRQFLDAYTYDNGKDFAGVTRAQQSDNTQKWIIKVEGNGVHTIMQKSNGRYLDAYDYANSTAAAGRYPVVTRAAQGNDTQRWVLKRTNRLPQKISINLNQYCKKNFDSSYKAVLVGKTTLDWVCQSNKGIRAKKACQQQHGTSVAGYTNKNDPYSWYCEKP